MRCWILAALVGVLSVPLFQGEARAQFVCQDTGGSAQGATAVGSANNSACGPNANASGGIVIGGGPAANTATGADSDASGGSSSNVSFGNNAISSGDGSGNVAIGADSDASGGGVGSVIGGQGNVVVGTRGTASDNGSALGRDTTATGGNSTAIGSFASATATNATAIGNGAGAAFSNSAAFGSGAATTRANQQSFGTASNTYTFAGVTSAASLAAQTGPISVVTTDSGGNLASATPEQLGLASSSRLNSVERKANRANAGVAMAMAMAGTPSLASDENFAVGANWGAYQGHNGFAASGAIRVSKNLSVNAGLGVTGGGNVGGRAGVRVGW